MPFCEGTICCTVWGCRSDLFHAHSANASPLRETRIEMKCDQIRDLMGAFLYGDLSPDEMREVRAHAQGCGECKRDLAARTSVVAAISDSAPALTDAERQRIAWAVRGAVSRAPVCEPAGRRWLPAFGVAMALVAGIALGTAINLVVSGRWNLGSQEAKHHSKPPRVVVQVKEEPVRHPAKQKTEIAVGKDDSSTKQQDSDAVRMTNALTQAVTTAIQRGTAVAVTRGQRKPDGTLGEKPARTQPEEKPVEMAAPPAGAKVPLPKGPNDVRTTVTDEGE